MKAAIGILFLVLLSFLFLQSVSAQDCTLVNVTNNCGNCIANTTKSCGWCAATQLCQHGNLSGPYGTPLCEGPSWQFGSCLKCSSFRDCRLCNANSADCFWCQSTGQCLPIGFVGCQYTDSCPCEDYYDCTECTREGTCNWCTKSQVCLNKTSVCPEPGDQPVNTCNCETYYDCTTCMEQDACQWCEQGSSGGNCVASGGSCAKPAVSCSYYCAQATHCVSCNALSGCGWCPIENRCVDPGVEKCMIMHQCPECGRHSYCEPCIDDSGCQWCETNQSCQPYGHACDMKTHQCAAYCALFTPDGCETCSNVRGCAWCENLGQCGDLYTTPNCLFTHICNEPPATSSCSFDGAAFVGGMFLIIGLLLLAVGGYYFYQWKTGRRFTYTELK
jgi:hypothetical protein